MGTQLTKATLWSDYPLENVSQGVTVEGLQASRHFFRRPDTEEVDALYAFWTRMSNTPTGYVADAPWVL